MRKRLQHQLNLPPNQWRRASSNRVSLGFPFLLRRDLEVTDTDVTVLVGITGLLGTAVIVEMGITPGKTAEIDIIRNLIRSSNRDQLQILLHLLNLATAAGRT